MLAIVCVLGIIWFFFNNSEKLILLSEINAGSIANLVLLMLAAQFLYTYRFQIVLERCAQRKVPIFSLFKIVVIGRYLSIFIPQSGNVYRGITLKSDFEISYTQYASSFFAFTWLEMCFNLLVALAVNSTVRPSLHIGNLSVMSILVALFFFVAIVPIFIGMLVRQANFQNPLFLRVGNKLSEMFSTVLKSLFDIVYLCKFFFTGLLTFAITLGAFHVAFTAIDVHAEISVLVLFFIVLQFFSQIIITPGNIGIKEILYGIISDQTNIGLSEGILMSVIMRITGTLVIIVMGSVLGGLKLLKENKNRIRGREKNG